MAAATAAVRMTTGGEIDWSVVTPNNDKALGGDLPDMSGLEFCSGAAAEAGKPVIVYFWAKYLKDNCYESMTGLNAIQDAGAIQIVGISADTAKKDVDKYIADAKYMDCTFPLAYDADNATRALFKKMQGNQGVAAPCLFLFNAEGKCVWTERFSKAANWSSVPTPQQSGVQIAKFLAGEALIDNGANPEIVDGEAEESAEDLFAAAGGDGSW